MGGDHSDPAEASSARLLLFRSGRAMERMLGDVDQAELRILRSEPMLTASIAELRAAVSCIRIHLLEEVKQYEKHGGSQPGPAGGTALDLGVLRDTIGRKLDRIRAARDAESVP